MVWVSTCGVTMDFDKADEFVSLMASKSRMNWLTSEEMKQLYDISKEFVSDTKRKWLSELAGVIYTDLMEKLTGKRHW